MVETLHVCLEIYFFDRNLSTEVSTEGDIAEISINFQKVTWYVDMIVKLFDLLNLYTVKFFFVSFVINVGARRNKMATGQPFVKIDIFPTI